MTWHVYILKCSNDSLYTGVTTDLTRRLHEHKQGQGSDYTKAYNVIEFCYSEEFLNKNEAFARESQIKKWTRRKKLALISGEKNLLKKL